MAGMDGEGAAAAGSAGNEFRSGGCAAGTDTALRKDILFRCMSSRSDAGCHLMDTRKQKEEGPLPLQLLACEKMAAVYSFGSIHRVHHSRSTFGRCSDCALQRIRTHRFEHPRSNLSGRKQHLRMDR